MASPMRKKRAWSTREDDAESRETAALDASVAAAKDTAAKSGAFLSNAKEDLTDHKRWLQAQSAAVDRDRARHERWLQRQREHRLAAARRERTKRRRQLMRQRATRAVQQATWAALLFIRSIFLLATAKIVAGFKYAGGMIAWSVAWTGAKIRAFAIYVARLIVAGARWTGAQLAAAARWLGRTVSAGFAWSGAKAQATARAGGSTLAAGSSLVASKAGVAGRSAGRSFGSALSLASAKGVAFAGATGRSASRGAAVASDKAAAVSAAGKRQLAAGYRWSKARAAALAPALYVRVAKYGRQAERYAKAGAARADGMFASARLPRSTGGPAPTAVIEIYGPHADGAEIGGRPANEPWIPIAAPQVQAEAVPAPVVEVPEVYGPFYEGFWVEGISPNEPRMPEPAMVAPQALESRERAKNTIPLWARDAWSKTAWVSAGAKKAWSKAVSSGSALAQTAWGRTRDAELSQMMIVAGAVLLVCGGLLLGGGLILRTGAGAGTTQQAAEDAPGGIAWTFDDLDRPLPERAVFTLSGTPESFRINGLSVGGVNASDQPLTAIEGVLKPDVQRPELKLTLKVDKPAAVAGEGNTAAQALDIAPQNTVPPHAPFRLVFAFPPEAMDGADGLTVEEFFESYGGLLLKLRYVTDGAQKAVIQYLPPELLKAQLDEVAAQAGGS